MDYNIAIGIGCTFISTSFFLVLYSRIRKLKSKLNKSKNEIRHLHDEIKSLYKKIDSKSEEISVLQKTPKSKEILEILNEINSTGTLLSISRVDQDNVYFHQNGR